MDSNSLLIVLIVVMIAGFASTVLLLMKRGKGPASDSLQLLQQQISQLTSIQNEKLDRTIKDLNERLREQDKTLSEHLDRSNVTLRQQFAQSQESMRKSNVQINQIIKDITEKMTKLDDTNKQVVNFAEQLQSLENILKNPKQRGVLGEYFLETVLKNVLPPDAFKLQYKFKNGEIVDALVITKDGNIPIDAKFSLENYNRLVSAETKAERDSLEKTFKEDLKRRIDETAKYIRPEEGTLDFAFMFIPADGLYYDLLVQRVGVLQVNSVDLIEYAFSKRVLIVSPTTFFAYIQTVLQGLRALKIEESTKQIQAQVEKLQKHMIAYVELYDRVGKHLATTVSAYENSAKELNKVDKDIIKIAGGESITRELTQVSRPVLELGD